MVTIIGNDTTGSVNKHTQYKTLKDFITKKS